MYSDLLMIACLFTAGGSSKISGYSFYSSFHLLFCMQNSSTYWEGKADMESLQRIYGISFPDAKMLKEWEKFQEEAKSRDHRKIGRVRQSVWQCISQTHCIHDLITRGISKTTLGCHNQDVTCQYFKSSFKARCFSLKEHQKP